MPKVKADYIGRIASSRVATKNKLGLIDPAQLGVVLDATAKADDLFLNSLGKYVKPPTASLSELTTASIPDSLDRRYVTDVEKTAITHLNQIALDAVKGINTGDQDLSKLVLGTDPRLSDARTPVLHGSEIHNPPSVLHGGYAGFVLKPGSTVDLDPKLATIFTLVPDQDCTLTVSIGSFFGQSFSIVLTTNGTTSRRVTFGTGFRSIGPLTTGTVTEKKFTISFVYDNTAWCEAGRTAAM